MCGIWEGKVSCTLAYIRRNTTSERRRFFTFAWLGWEYCIQCIQFWAVLEGYFNIRHDPLEDPQEVKDLLYLTKNEKLRGLNC